MPYKSFDEAIRLARLIYGLGANIIPTRARSRSFQEIQAGTIWINDPLTDTWARSAAIKRRAARVNWDKKFEEFQQSKHIHWDFEQKTKPWWYPYLPKGNHKK